MSKVKKYDPFGYDGLSAFMTECEYGDFVRYDDYATLEAEHAKLRAELERGAIDGYALVPRKPTPAMRVIGARDCSALIQPDQAEEVWLAMLGAAVVPAEYAFPQSAQSAPKADDPVKQMLLEALEEILYAEIHSPISMNNAGCIKKMQGIARAAIAAARKGE